MIHVSLLSSCPIWLNEITRMEQFRVTNSTKRTQCQPLLDGKKKIYMVDSFHRMIIFLFSSLLCIWISERWQPNRYFIIATASIVQLHQFHCWQWRHWYPICTPSSWIRFGTSAAHHCCRHYGLLVNFNGKVFVFYRFLLQLHLLLLPTFVLRRTETNLNLFKGRCARTWTMA